MIINGDAGRVPLGDKLVHCVVTSPPYWSLRKYAGEQERDWGEVRYAAMPGMGEIVIEPVRCALGLEKTVEAFIGHLVLVFREVGRVLRDDGVAWCVIGDSYGGDGGDLIMVPHRLALALQADGWVVRNDCPWNKVNPMPESVRGWTWQRCRVKVGSNNGAGKQATNVGSLTAQDGGVDIAQWSDCPGCAKCADTDGYVLRRGSWRHTRAHETVLMLVKGMQYFSDQEKVRERCSETSHGGPNVVPGCKNEILGQGDGNLGKWTDEQKAAGRNPRSVLTVTGESYSGAHYAVFPRALIAPLIRATCPAKCCPMCGAGWSPVVERDSIPTRPGNYSCTDETKDLFIEKGSGGNTNLRYRTMSDTTVLGYRPSCECLEYDTESYGGPNDVGEMPQQPRPYAPIPGIVLDPFLGSGTVGMVAKELGLRWIGLDLAHEYLDQQAKVRTQTGARSDALEGLPMFGGNSGER